MKFAIENARTFVGRSLIVMFLAIVACDAGWTQALSSALYRNEAEIAELIGRTDLDVKSPVAVFAFVLNNLPERVQVYPTENYYYVRFVADGVTYSGNIRLAADNRDQGKVHFAYSELPTDHNPDPEVRHILLDASHAVSVERLASLSYRITHAGKSVTFTLNDLANVRPPPGLLTVDERYLGPIFDESAIRFFLVFNARLKIFHYLLDDSHGVADQFVAAKATDRITIGKRTGFAFYRDDAGRRILIGVGRRSSLLNTYFDGPFDQLPENFINGDELQDAIVAASPDAAGQIDRYGNFPGGEDRFLIHPYWRYQREGELTAFHRCATRVPVSRRPLCFVVEDQDSERADPRPLALKQRR